MCRAAAADDDRRHWLVYRGGQVMVMLNRYPYNSGHVMVIPRTHVADPGALGEVEWAALQAELRLAVRVVRAVYRPEAMNIGMNLGRAAGAGIDDHLHWHVVPRWTGDNSYMPVLADTRVVVEALDEAWQRLQAGFADAGGA